MSKAHASSGGRRYAANRQASANTLAPQLKRAILAACARLGLDDDARRDLQQDIIGKASLTAMTLPELVRLRDHLNRDWSGPNKDRPHMGKIRALWWSLYWIGAIRRVDDEALTAFVKRQTGIEKLRFLGHLDAPPVIEALKSWLEREGVEWWSAQQLADVQKVEGARFDAALADRHAVLAELARRLDRAGLMHQLARYEWLGKRVNRAGNMHWSFTAEELDEGIRALGKKFRRYLDGREQSL